jgi:hypothetical protein
MSNEIGLDWLMKFIKSNFVWGIFNFGICTDILLCRLSLRVDFNILLLANFKGSLNFYYLFCLLNQPAKFFVEKLIISEMREVAFFCFKMLLLILLVSNLHKICCTVGRLRKQAKTKRCHDSIPNT